MIGTVCKWIGIVILVLIAGIVLWIAGVLWIPFKYQADIRYDRKADGSIHAGWLPLFLKVELLLRENHPAYTIKIFGSVVYTNTDVPLGFIGRRLHFAQQEERPEPAKKPVKEAAAPETAGETVSKNKNADAENDVRSEPDAAGKPGFRDRFRRIWKGLCHIRDKKDALLKVYHSKRFDIARKDVVEYGRKLFRILRPKKLSGYIHYGTEDPALTGQIAGGIAMLLPFYDSFLDVRPDFEKSCLDGHVQVKGKIILFPVAMLVLKGYNNKNLIKVAKKVQTIIES